MKKILFLGGKEIGFWCLNYLINNTNELNCKLIGVLASDKSIGETSFSFPQLCENENIPFLTDLNQILDFSEIDIIISVQYHQILKPSHIAKATDFSVNLHMAPLPEYRGCNQFSFAIIEQAKVFGTTFHILNEGVDAGAILFEKRFSIPENIFVADLYAQTLHYSKLLFSENISKIIAHSFIEKPQKQFSKTRKSGFHSREEIKTIKTIKSSWNIEKQKRYFRATYFPPFPPPKLEKEGRFIDSSIEWYNSLKIENYEL